MYGLSILQVDNVLRVCREILCFDVLLKRKVLFDALEKGLQEFQLISAFHAFPELFLPLFVGVPPNTPADVFSLLHFEQPYAEGSDRARVAGYLMGFIGKLSKPGEYSNLLRSGNWWYSP